MKYEEVKSFPCQYFLCCRQAPAGDAATGRILRLPEEGTREEVSSAEVHLETRQEETGRETGPKGFPGRDGSS